MDKIDQIHDRLFTALTDMGFDGSDLMAAGTRIREALEESYQLGQETFNPNFME